MKEVEKSTIKVTVKSFYIEEQSEPSKDHFVFGYTIRIVNTGKTPARLMSRHWIISDADGNVHEVRGPGVVGEQPYIRAGEGFEYTSGAVLKTPIGSMRGSYHMLNEQGSEFQAEIPVFRLSVPNSIH